jgi:hypothetical protein
VRKMSDEELRRLFAEKAGRFSMDPALPTAVVRRARARLLAGATGAAVAILMAVAVSAVGGAGPPSPPSDAAPDAVRMVAYVTADDPTDVNGPAQGSGEAASLRQFASCMRGRGFVVHDPILTDEGWTIPVPARPPDTPAWREAAFVRCRPPHVHLTGDLVLGGRTDAEIDAFGECMRRQGYDLPQPSRDGNEHVFDLRETGFDTDADAFHRAAMVTCAPGLP